MANLNKVLLIGNLTRDPELRYTPSGKPVVSFTIACNRKFKSGDELKEEVAFIGCVAWDKTAELVDQYVKKGHSVFVEGRLTQDTYEDKEGKKQTKTKVTVENIQFLTAKPKEVDSGSSTE